MIVKSYKELIVWQKSMRLALEVYRLAKILPKFETYALADQMRRAALSIPSNIAEGQGRDSTKEFIRFLSIARGSCFELETQLNFCILSKYFDEEVVEVALNLLDEIGKMLTSLIKKLRSQLSTIH